MCAGPQSACRQGEAHSREQDLCIEHPREGLLPAPRSGQALRIVTGMTASPQHHASAGPR